MSRKKLIEWASEAIHSSLNEMILSLLYFRILGGSKNYLL